jgi:hypothetical protein
MLTSFSPDKNSFSINCSGVNEALLLGDCNIVVKPRHIPTKSTQNLKTHYLNDSTTSSGDEFYEESHKRIALQSLSPAIRVNHSKSYSQSPLRTLSNNLSSPDLLAQQQRVENKLIKTKIASKINPSLKVALTSAVLLSSPIGKKSTNKDGPFLSTSSKQRSTNNNNFPSSYLSPTLVSNKLGSNVDSGFDIFADVESPFTLVSFDRLNHPAGPHEAEQVFKESCTASSEDSVTQPICFKTPHSIGGGVSLSRPSSHRSHATSRTKNGIRGTSSIKKLEGKDSVGTTSTNRLNEKYSSISREEKRFSVSQESIIQPVLHPTDASHIPFSPDDRDIKQINNSGRGPLSLIQKFNGKSKVAISPESIKPGSRSPVNVTSSTDIRTKMSSLSIATTPIPISADKTPIFISRSSPARVRVTAANIDAPLSHNWREPPTSTSSRELYEIENKDSVTTECQSLSKKNFSELLSAIPSENLVELEQYDLDKEVDLLVCASSKYNLSPEDDRNDLLQARLDSDPKNRVRIQSRTLVFPRKSPFSTPRIIVGSPYKQQSPQSRAITPVVHSTNKSDLQPETVENSYLSSVSGIMEKYGHVFVSPTVAAFEAMSVSTASKELDSRVSVVSINANNPNSTNPNPNSTNSNPTNPNSNPKSANPNFADSEKCQPINGLDKVSVNFMNSMELKKREREGRERELDSSVSVVSENCRSISKGFDESSINLVNSMELSRSDNGDESLSLSVDSSISLKGIKALS